MILRMSFAVTNVKKRMGKTLDKNSPRKAWDKQFTLMHLCLIAVYTILNCQITISGTKNWEREWEGQKMVKKKKMQDLHLPNC